MVQIAMKVCWTDAGNSSASFMSWSSNSTDVAPFARLLFVSLFPPLTKRFSLLLILLALDISLWFSFEHAETPTFPTWVGPLSVYALELSANVICWNLDPRFTDVIAWELYSLINYDKKNYDPLSMSLVPRDLRCLRASPRSLLEMFLSRWKCRHSVDILYRCGSFLLSPAW